MKILIPLFTLLCVNSALAEEFCARIRGVSYLKKSTGVEAFMYLDQVRGAQSHATLRNSSLKIRDEKAVFKVAKVISLTSIQNQEQLKQDLAQGNLDWYYLAGDEQHPNPIEEDFTACLEADLNQTTQGNELFKATVTDVLEDGHSLKDLF